VLDRRHEAPNVKPAIAAAPALAIKTPAELYAPSSRPYGGLPELSYPFHDRDILVTSCGRICMHKKKINVSQVLAGQRLGIRQVDDGIWLVSFMRYDLRHIDLEQRTLQTIDNPHRARGCHPCLRYNLLPMSPGRTLNCWCPGVELNHRHYDFQNDC
jgi:hypothetical protein